MTHDGASIEEILGAINRKLKSILPASLFLCAAMVEISRDRNAMSVWNGGLPDLLVVTARGEISHRLTSEHLPLGVLDDKKFDPGLTAVSAEQGDCVYAYSDGIIEALDLSGEMFGQERLEALCACQAEGGWRIDRIVEAFNTFCLGRARDDDYTISEVRLT